MSNMTDDERITHELSGFSRDMFADWLLNVLFFSHKLPYQGEISCAVRTSFGQRESILDDLEYVYDDCMPDENKKFLFRQAIGCLFEQIGSDKNTPISVLQDLVFLAAIIKAEEALNSIVLVVGNGPLGERCPNLIRDTISTIKAFPSSCRVSKALTALINSKNFDDKFLLDAVETLVDLNPFNQQAIVRAYKERLEVVLQAEQKHGGNAWEAFCQSIKNRPQPA